MVHTRRLMAAILMVLGVVACLFTSAVPALAWQDSVQQFATKDAEMNAAIDSARRNLPQFLAALDAARKDNWRGADEFSVKVGIPSDSGVEHIWMTLGHDPVALGETVTGVIVNEPYFIEGLKLGDRYQASLSQISDWSYWQGDLLHGNYTTRVMLPQMPAQDAAQLRAVLAPLD